MARRAGANRPPRYLGALVLAGIAAGGLSACTPGTNAQDDAEVSEKITSVRLDSSSGGVTINGREGAGRISVHRSIDYQDDRPGTTTRVENGVLVLGGCGQHCSVNYTLEVPAGLPVDGQTSSGAVSLTRVGPVKVTTHSGGITLDGVAGPVEVQTTNGAIRGTGLNGDRIQAQTSNGQIDLTPAKAQDVRAKTSNGAISLTVPAATYKVAAQTSNGRKEIGVTNDPAGRYQLDLTTSNGRITVKNA
ncbi:DUF4097 domain-containing protein [Kitasatospora sp. NPDC048239]|uniref:DUF4097 family beta strand repeat-containing protein n=1 Tax=Kitasatospora sp. NPDC048239 TaxID=3364046 RepID=UPI003720D260